MRHRSPFNIASSVAALTLLAVAGCSSDAEEPSGGAGQGGSATAGGTTGASGGSPSPSNGGSGGVASGAAANGGAGASAGTAGTSAGSGGSEAGSANGGSASGGSASGGSASGGSASGGSAGAAGSGGSVGIGGVGGSNGGSAGSGGAPPNPTVTPCETSQLSRCSGSPLACHFGGSPGNYEVTVQLGAGTANVEAEFYRRMLTQTSTDSKWFSFVTNVRVYEGEPLRPDQDSAYTTGIAGLDIYFRGPSPKPLSICYKPASAPVMLWIEGDSTVTDQQTTDYSGWGQHLPQHFLPPISVANYADSGESSSSVLASKKLWPVIKAGMKKGDWVLVQLGHNDKSTTAASFRANLLTMVNDSKAAGANVVLVTPISRATYTLAQQHVNELNVNLPAIIRDLGKSENVPVIDLTVTTYNWLQTIDWPKYFALGTDKTHTNQQGADIISGFVRDAVKKDIPALAKYLRD